MNPFRFAFRVGSIRKIACVHAAWLALLGLASGVTAAEAKRLLILGQGPDGHPPGTHEFLPGARVVEHLLKPFPAVRATIVRADEPWTDGPALLDQADGVVLLVTQGAQFMQMNPARHAAFQRLAARQGGLVALHWAVGAKDEQYIQGQLELLGGTRGGPQRKYKVLETDVTIADFCADLRAPTPTAAAELCALERATDLDQLQSLQGSLVQAATGRLALAAQRLDRAEQQLGRPSAWLHRQTQRGLGLTHRLIRAATQAAHRQSLALQPLAPRLQRAALEMPLSLARRLDKAQWRLQSLDPKAVLKRGYAWLENNQGQALASVEDLKPGERVVARLVDGQASLEVKQVL